jgi:hypothetical protein
LSLGEWFDLSRSRAWAIQRERELADPDAHVVDAEAAGPEMFEDARAQIIARIGAKYG